MAWRIINTTFANRAREKAIAEEERQEKEREVRIRKAVKRLEKLGLDWFTDEEGKGAILESPGASIWLRISKCGHYYEIEDRNLPDYIVLRKRIIPVEAEDIMLAIGRELRRLDETWGTLKAYIK